MLTYQYGVHALNEVDKLLGESVSIHFNDLRDETVNSPILDFLTSTLFFDGEDRAIILATEYVTQMKKLITEERTRLEQLKESMYAIC